MPRTLREDPPPARSADDAKREDIVLDVLKQVVPAIAGIYGSSCEIVVHDLRHPEASIVALENGAISSRELGGPLVGGPMDDEALTWLYQYSESTQVKIYETRTKDGRRLKSASVVFRNSRHKPYAAFCLNLDVSSLQAVAKWMTSLVEIPPAAELRTEAVSPSDVDTVLDGLIEECVQAKGISAGSLPRDERRRLLQELDDRGAFLIKGAVKRVAGLLSVSKYTIYNDLESLRNE